MASNPRLAEPGQPDKAAFANRVEKFVRRVSDLPAFPTLELCGLAAALTAIVVGAFGTASLPLVQRAGFWLLLMGWTTLKWQAWFAWRVRGPADWWRAAAIGAVVLNLPLPLEVSAALAAFGIKAALSPATIWIDSAAICVLLAVSMSIVNRNARRVSAADDTPAQPAGGPLARAGIDRDAVLAIRSEDHYCRVLLSGGRERLILCRLADAIGELAGVNGAQVHRGAWVADATIVGARRVDRTWRLKLTEGSEVPVSGSFRAEARRRGWLDRREPL